MTTNLSEAGSAILARQRDRIAAMRLGHVEANTIGHQVAFEAEQASRMGWTDKLAQAGDPTKQEAERLAKATAARQESADRTYLARQLAMETDRRYQGLFAAGYWRDDATPADRRRLDDARREAHKAMSDYDQALEADHLADQAFLRVKAELAATSTQRVRRAIAAM